MKSEIRVIFIVLLIIMGALMLTLSGCSFRRINKSKEIVYLKAENAPAKLDQKLNVFAPKTHKVLCDVVVFIHGGNWNSGRKGQYNIIGKHWARKGVAYVVIDYPLSPSADYSEMATSSAVAIKWVKENIANYGGNPGRIFVSGHSAGGHLAALVSMDDRYFQNLKIPNPIAGTILIDAAGLDMYGYLQEEKLPEDQTYFKTFSHDPKKWKEATPLYHIRPDQPPMIIFRGGKTYPSIFKSNEKFVKELKSKDFSFDYLIQKRKKHVPMITQFFNPWNRRYGQITRFMRGVKQDNPSVLQK